MGYNQVVISSGHSINCQGAVGIINEVLEARRVVDRVRDILVANGVKCYKYHDISSSSSVNLYNIVDFHNRYSEGVDVSIHFNAHVHTSSPKGVEVCHYGQKTLAVAVSEAIAKAGGLINRGEKYRNNLFFLKKTKKPAILIEVCFVDSVEDCRLYKNNFENICQAIAGALMGKENLIKPTEIKPIEYTDADRERLAKIEEAKKFVGDRCKELQEKLIKLGYKCGGYGADGRFGASTYDDLIKFQKDNGLEADGLAGAKTFAKLDELIAKQSVKPTVKGDDWVRRLQAECNKQGFSNQVVDGIAGKNTLNGCPTLSRGVRGTITKLLQERLGITQDGVFGRATQQSVINYQRANKLTADGIVGTKTWKKLLGL